MKALLALGVCFGILSAFDYHLSPVKVDEGIYCFFGKPEAMDRVNNGNMVNSCYVDTGTEWLVIDSGPTYAYAKEASTQIQRIKPQPVGLVIDTHVHDDHWLGNGYFASQGIAVVGPSLFKQAVNPSEKTRMQKRISPEAYAGTAVTLPTRFIDANETVQLGTETIRLIRIDEKAHTAEDFVVYLPGRETLFAGDLVFNDRLPSLRDGNINGWIRALESLRELEPKHVIGGHGVRTDAEADTMTYDYLVALRDAVQKAIDDDIGIAEATRSIRIDAFRDAAMYDIMHAQNVETAYRTLEWEDE